MDQAFDQRFAEIGSMVSAIRDTPVERWGQFPPFGVASGRHGGPDPVNGLCQNPGFLAPPPFKPLFSIRFSNAGTCLAKDLRKPAQRRQPRTACAHSEEDAATFQGRSEWFTGHRFGGSPCPGSIRSGSFRCASWHGVAWRSRDLRAARRVHPSPACLPKARCEELEAKRRAFP